MMLLLHDICIRWGIGHRKYCVGFIPFLLKYVCNVIWTLINVHNHNCLYSKRINVHLLDLSDVSWVPCRVKPPTAGLLVQQLVRINNKRRKHHVSVLLYYCLCITERETNGYWWFSPHKWPVMGKAFPCRNFIMSKLKVRESYKNIISLWQENHQNTLFNS